MKKTILTLSLLAVTAFGSVFSQTINYNEASFFGSRKHQKTIDIAVDYQGNSITVGEFDSIININGVDSVTGYGSIDVFLVKKDSNGNVLWQKTFGSFYGIDRIVSVKLDPQGNIYIAGETSGVSIIGTDTIGSVYSSVPFYAKLNALGTFIWAKDFDRVAYQNYIRDMTIAANGDLYMTGSFKDSMSIEGHKLRSTSVSPYVAHFDNNGNYISAILLPVTDNSRGKAIAVTKDKGFVVVGHFKDSIDFGVTVLNDGFSAQRGFVAKYDSNMTCVWAKLIYSNTSTFSAEVDNNQNVIVHYKNAILKLNESGATQWTTGFNSGTNVYGIALNNKNEVFAYGHFSGTVLFNTTQLISNGGTDFFITKLDTNGNIVWADGDGGSGNDYLRGIDVYKANKIYAGGYFFSPSLALGSYSGTNSTGFLDAFSFNFNLNVLVSVSEMSSVKLNFSIFPNPATNLINMDVTETIKSLKIWNIQGQLITQTIPTSKTIDVSGFKSGIYIIQVVTEKGVGTSRFVKK